MISQRRVEYSTPPTVSTGRGAFFIKSVDVLFDIAEFVTVLIPMCINKTETLARLFPDCVEEYVDASGALRRRLNCERLQSAIADAIETSGSCLLSQESGTEAERERYEFIWQGKAAARRDAYSPTEKRLNACKKQSVDWDSTQNLYIEGENLDALKLLRAKYSGQIKVIYIDPPYNTGNGFVYRDDYRVSQKEWKESDGTPEKYEESTPDFRSELGRIHASWCSMFYSRALIARELLADDGVMLTSIDDRELGNTIKILDEVFGESAHCATLIWETHNEAKGIPPTSMCVRNHEYILAYSRQASYRFLGELRQVADGFSNPDDDPRGPWKRQYLQRFGQGFPVRTVTNPADGVAYSFETPYTEARMAQLVEDGRIVFPKEPNRYPIRKEFFSEYENPYKPIVSSWGVYNTKVGTEELKKLFDGVRVFDYPKPLRLMVDLLRQTLGPDDVALDFFSGSGTTAHAVMTLNAEDGGRRRFIAVQRPDVCDSRSVAFKAGYRTVSDVGKERLRRAGEALRQQKNDAERMPDVGFRVYSLASRTCDVIGSREKTSWSAVEENASEDHFDVLSNSQTPAPIPESFQKSPSRTAAAETEPSTEITSSSEAAGT